MSLAPRGRGQGEGAENASVISRTVLNSDQRIQNALEQDYRSRAAPALELAGAGGGWAEDDYVHYWLYEWLLFCEAARRCSGSDRFTSHQHLDVGHFLIYNHAELLCTEMPDRSLALQAIASRFPFPRANSDRRGHRCGTASGRCRQPAGSDRYRWAGTRRSGQGPRGRPHGSRWPLDRPGRTP